VSNVLALGPGEEAFSALIGLADKALAVDVYRAGAADDATSITGYDLYAFDSVLSEAGGKRNTAWAALIRVDNAGQAYPVRWEALANLIPTKKPGTIPHPGHEQIAIDTATHVAKVTLTEHQRVRTEWFAQARHDLQGLPTDLTIALPREQRLTLRHQLEVATASRLAQLEGLSQVTITQPRLAARLRVHAAAVPLTVEEKNSEMIAMRMVAQVLSNDGWQVADIHSENRGYDLHAVRGRDRRLIEVKGVWDSAAAAGIRMTGNEVLIATQHKGDYWLYVVDGCSDGTGAVFGRYRDPAALFSNDMVGDAIFRVPGSSLTKASTAGNP
jgi:hypothetical protein